MGAWSFNYCSNLTKVFCKPTTPPELVSNDYDYYIFFDYDASIYVPNESIGLYKSHPIWGAYKIIGYDF